MNREIWKDIDAYNGLYQVSDTGLVRSLDRTVVGNGVDYIRKGKLMSLTKNSFGYLKVGFTVDGKTKSISVHRIVAEAFILNPENKKCVNHKDGDKTNNHISNLEWCTYSENSIHANKTGLSDFRKNRKAYSGEKNGNSLLTKEQVIEIKSKYKPYTYSASMLAKEYGVSRSCIEHIINNKSWKTI